MQTSLLIAGHHVLAKIVAFRHLVQPHVDMSTKQIASRGQKAGHIAQLLKPKLGISRFVLQSHMQLLKGLQLVVLTTVAVALDTHKDAMPQGQEMCQNIYPYDRSPSPK